ncbi:hypothetical protein NPIL_32241 [Nephila pilipes]|uniref:Uncharacterized protein n=1 Tax=Nephila pilipes TaxID=299642 RepID=A0A8X6UBE7_NEPPI|nr:hypothetical protein NPIL_32241 [Nephila pilipes]
MLRVSAPAKQLLLAGGSLFAGRMAVRGKMEGGSATGELAARGWRALRFAGGSVVAAAAAGRSEGGTFAQPAYGGAAKAGAMLRVCCSLLLQRAQRCQQHASARSAAAARQRLCCAACCAGLQRRCAARYHAAVRLFRRALPLLLARRFWPYGSGARAARSEASGAVLKRRALK